MPEDKKTEQQLKQEFIEAYKKLCDDHGFMISVMPVWKQSMDVGDWRMVLQTNVQRLPKK
jgi:hypothetical protein